MSVTIPYDKAVFILFQDSCLTKELNRAYSNDEKSYYAAMDEMIQLSKTNDFFWDVFNRDCYDNNNDENIVSKKNSKYNKEFISPQLLMEQKMDDAWGY